MNSGCILASTDNFLCVVIPAKAGIQRGDDQSTVHILHPGLRRGDDEKMNLSERTP